MSCNVAYFRNGYLYDVLPRNKMVSLYEDRQVAYDAELIMSDGCLYDISTIEGIEGLPVPFYKGDAWNATLEMSYIMKLHCGKVQDPDLIPPFVNKVIVLMKASSLLWRPRDYLQVIRNYHRNGLFEAGNQFEESFRNDNRELFVGITEREEKEHQRTKKYFMEKWAKKKQSK